MPGRRDDVTIALERGDDVTIPWASRDALLHRLVNVESAQGIVDAFTAVGATRPVELTEADKLILYGFLEGWSLMHALEKSPAGLEELRLALSDDLAEAPS